MKSVCIDARLIRAPGIGTYLRNLLSHCKQTPWKWFALIHKQHLPEIAAWDYIEPIIVSSPIYSIQEQCVLPWKIPRVDLFWSAHYNVPCLPIRARKRLVSIHDAFHLTYSSTLSPMERIYAKWMMRSAMRLSDHVITCSNFSKKEIETHTRMHPAMSVIPYGVDGDMFHTGVEDNSVIKKYGIEGPFLLYVGSFKAHKNLRGLVKAFSLLKEDVKLVVVGGGAGMRHCEDVKQLCIAYPELQEKICFVGHVSDEELPHFYRHAQVFVFPSFYEGFGFPPLEAMRAGCPAVVGRAGALPEVCGEGALFVDPHVPEQIAEGITELLQDEEKRKNLIAKGLERSAQFCWERCAEAHCAVIEGLIG